MEVLCALFHALIGKKDYHWATHRSKLVKYLNSVMISLIVVETQQRCYPNFIWESNTVDLDKKKIPNRMSEGSHFPPLENCNSYFIFLFFPSPIK